MVVALAALAIWWVVTLRAYHQTRHDYFAALREAGDPRFATYRRQRFGTVRPRGLVGILQQVSRGFAVSQGQSDRTLEALRRRVRRAEFGVLVGPVVFFAVFVLQSLILPPGL